MKIETHPNSQKQSQMLKLLQFGTVMVFVDSRRPDVLVPDHLKGDYQLRLNFDYAYEVDDFRVLPDCIEASLSFNRKDHFCVIPFEAVYLVVNHNIKNGVLFTQTVPVEMLEFFAAEAQKEQQAERAKEMQPSLSVIEDDLMVDQRKAVGSSDQKKKSSPRKKGHLRLVQ